MIKESESIEVHIRTAIQDLFGSESLSASSIETIVSVITDFVLLEIPKITDGNSYELFYVALGKAVAIAQGWKINCYANSPIELDVRKSLKEYMINTYGFQYKEKL